MNRSEIEIVLNRDRAWLLETLSAMPAEELMRGVTQSQHDPESQWSYADHFIHTYLIEKRWNAMFRAHLDGIPNAVGIGRSDDGKSQTREELMAGIHAWTEDWAKKNRGKPLDELVALSQATRSETLELLSSLTDEQLQSKIPGAPWADGTVGGIMAANAGHGRTHFGYAKEGAASA